MALYGFCDWYDSGFSAKSIMRNKNSPVPVSTTDEAAPYLFFIGLGLAGYFSFQTSIMFHHSQDELVKRKDTDDADP